MEQINPPLTLIPVAPIGRREAMAFVDYADGTGDYRSVPVDDYPDSPLGIALRLLRVNGGVTIRRGAEALGLSCTELSGLESGRLTLGDEDWQRLMNAVAEVVSNTKDQQ